MTMLRIYKLSPPGAQVIDFNYVEKICVGTKQVGIQVFINTISWNSVFGYRITGVFVTIDFNMFDCSTERYYIT